MSSNKPEEDRAKIENQSSQSEISTQASSSPTSLSASESKQSESVESKVQSQASPESDILETSKESDDEEKVAKEDKAENMIDNLRDFFLKTLNLGDKEGVTKGEQVLDELSLDGIVRYIKSGKCKNVIAMVGAGISTSAGIPDFRSPVSGLYSNLGKYDLPSPEAIFDISYFKDKPQPFFQLAKELFPGKFKPTPCHYFLRLLDEKGLLLRLYSQNIDTLERVAGISGDKLVEAHGTFYTSHCLKAKCRTEYSLEWMRERIMADEIPECLNCKSTVKPDIVFFGERLPNRYFQLSDQDFSKCDLLIIIGTSLTVQPFAGLIDNVPSSCPRFMINKTKAGQYSSQMASMLGLDGGMDFDSKDRYRDVLWKGDCDEGCLLFADKMGWKSELMSLIEEDRNRGALD